MFLADGELALGRYRVIEALPAWGELSRWRAVDEADGGRAVELCAPSALACLRPGTVEAFRQAFAPGQALPRGAAPPLDLGEHRQRPLGVRAAGLRPLSPRLGPAELAGLIGAVGPALAAAAGRYAPRALVVDDAGQPWVAADGIVDPPPLGAAPLSPADDLWARALGAPPDGRPARAHAPGLTEAEAALLDALRQGIPALPPPLLPLCLPAAEPRPVPSPGVGVGQDAKITSTTTSSLRSPPTPRAAGSRLALVDGAPTDRALRRLAAVAGVDERRLLASRGRGGPIPVGFAPDAAAGAAWAAALGPTAALRLVEAPRGGAWLPLLVATVGLGLGALGLAQAAFSGGAVTLGVVIFGLLAALGGVAFGAARAWALARHRAHRRAAEALRAGGQPDALLSAFASARAAALRASLPAPARDDLLELVDELQEALPEAPSAADVAEVCAQLDAVVVGVEASAASSALPDVRGRLARTVAASRA